MEYNNKNIFNYLNIYSNDQLSELTKTELENILYYINCYYLELRDSLEISNNVTFGLEIECEEVDVCELEKLIFSNKLNDRWCINDDVSLFKGKEIVSPVLIDNQMTWKELIKICKFISDNAVIGKNTASHIHIGAQVLSNNNAWLNFLKIWAVYENIIFRFLYGEFLTARPSLKNNASPCSNTFLINYDYLKSKKDNILEFIKNISDKNSAVNLKNVLLKSFLCGNTIEFRCANGTFEPVIWQNNVNLLTKLLIYCKSDDFNNEIIDKRRSLVNQKNMIVEKYHHIYLKEALEFCDLIFDNNLDKIYFLRQYLKSFEVSNRSIGLDETKCFIKRICN